jgi:chromosome segregation ATPase
MRPARTTSPTALLWAHQLKREHNHLLDRIKILETASSTLASRINVTEKSAHDALKIIDTVNKLSVKVQAIAEDDSSQQRRFEELDRDRGERFEKLGEGVKKVEKRLQALEKDLDDCDKESEEKKEGAAREKELLVDRIGKLESEYAKLKEGAGKGEKLTRKDDTTNTEVLNRRIEALDARRKEEGIKVKGMLEKFEKIEKGWSSMQGQLKRALDKLEAMYSVPKPVALSRPTPHVASSSPSVVQVPESPSAGRQTRR